MADEILTVRTKAKISVAGELKRVMLQMGDQEIELTIEQAETLYKYLAVLLGKSQ